MPAMPAMPSMPQLPQMPDYSEYLPDMPDVPLPDTIRDTIFTIKKYDNEYVSPLIQRLNHTVVILSLLSMMLYLLSDTMGSLFQFRPSSLMALSPFKSDSKEDAIAAPQLAADETSAKFYIPHVWTLITGNLIEMNPFFLVSHLGLINYIVQKNQDQFQQNWSSSDFIRMICVSSVLSNLNLFMLKIMAFGISKDYESYFSYQHASLNLIILMLLVALRMQTIQSMV